MASKFKVGDIVQLKSGGPKMTVTEIHDTGVRTAWFAGSKNEQGYFPFDAIMLPQEDKKP